MTRSVLASAMRFEQSGEAPEGFHDAIRTIARSGFLAVLARDLASQGAPAAPGASGPRASRTFMSPEAHRKAARDHRQDALLLELKTNYDAVRTSKRLSASTRHYLERRAEDRDPVVAAQARRYLEELQELYGRGRR
jgi:hypothetical protein